MKKTNQKGFILKLIVILVALFFILSYFNINIKSVMQSPTTVENAKYLLALGKSIWSGYLEKPTDYLWNNIFADYIKGAFKQNIENLTALKEGRAAEIQIFPQFLPQLPQMPAIPGINSAVPN
ncbi:MAG: hypothetical protein AAB355_02805 [Patescibacteria group bacterium]